MNEKILYRDEVYAIQGAIFEVYKEKGCGFSESVYQECLRREFLNQKIPFVAQAEITIEYKGDMLEQYYKPDFICFDKIIIELKAVTALAPEHVAQLLNYLRATQNRLGLLVNFGHYPKVEIRRVIL